LKVTRVGKLIMYTSWQPVVDGAFLADFATKQLAAGKFVKIPTIVGKHTEHP
jgi:hypothetical protein